MTAKSLVVFIATFFRTVAQCQYEQFGMDSVRGTPMNWTTTIIIAAIVALHCASGMRSGTAKNKLKGMGYLNSFNLGPYGRAEEIVGQAGGN